jgi:hypothetical protein
MSRRGRTKSPPFVMIEKAMLKSEAWQMIGNAGRVVYIHLKNECKYGGQVIVELTHKSMEPFMTHRTFATAIQDLIKTGFIEVEKQGGLYRFKNVFRLVEGWRTYKNQSSRREITPSIVQKMHRRSDPEGFDGVKNAPSRAFLGDSTV